METEGSLMLDTIVYSIGAITMAYWSGKLLAGAWRSLRTPNDRSGNSGRFGHFSGLIHDPLIGSSTKENDK